MASATRTRDHGQIRSWVEARGGVPTVVKGTEGLLRIDFVQGPQSGGREDSLEQVAWEKWFDLFDEHGLSFLHSPEKESRFFKLVYPTDGGRTNDRSEPGVRRRSETEEEEEDRVLYSPTEEHAHR